MASPIEFYPQTAPQPEELEDVTEAYRRYEVARAGLHAYSGAVISRVPMADPEELPYATIHTEIVHFGDGAVRTLTRSVPNIQKLSTEERCPVLVSATDALCTGPDGLNKIIIKGLAERGFAVAWLHHQGRHMELPTSQSKVTQFGRLLLHKSVGRSAHHQHGVLDDLQLAGEHDTSTVISIGDSRSAMTGEAVDALGEMYGRKTLSDHNASCFEHAPTMSELPGLALSPIHEAVALTRLAWRLKQSGISIGELVSYLGTFDLHPVNSMNELSWVFSLMSGDAGRYGDAVPLDQRGVRTHLNGDTWSSGGVAWAEKYSIRPNITLIKRALPSGRIARHVDLADPSVQIARFDRLERSAEQFRAGTSVSDLDMRYIVHGIRSIN